MNKDKLRDIRSSIKECTMLVSTKGILDILDALLDESEPAPVDVGEGYRLIDVVAENGTKKPTDEYLFPGNSNDIWNTCKGHGTDKTFLQSGCFYRRPIPIPGDVWGLPGDEGSNVWIQADVDNLWIIRSCGGHINLASQMSKSYVLKYRGPK